MDLIQEFENCEQCGLRPNYCYGVTEMFGLAGCGSFNHDQCKQFRWTCVCDIELLQDRIKEVEGFGGKLRTRLKFDPALLPPFIPTIYHRYGRTAPAKLNFAAIPLYKLFAAKSSGLILKPQNSSELRKMMGVSTQTKIIVTGAGPDEFIEAFWRWHRKSKLFEALKLLSIHALTIPNYSFPLDCPPLHHRYNRSRILRLAERASAAGLNVILHLNAIHNEEWNDWEKILVEHPEIKAICAEFQTGYKIRATGWKAFQRLVQLRTATGRPLHLIAIGARRLAKEIGAEFENHTIIGADSFLRTQSRRSLWVDEGGKLRVTPRRLAQGSPLDGQLDSNVRAESESIAIQQGRKKVAQQYNLPFTVPNSGPMRTPCKQKNLSNLPLLKITGKQREGDSAQASANSPAIPNLKPSSRRIEISEARVRSILKSATNHPNSRHRNNGEKQRPNGSATKIAAGVKADHSP